MERKIRIVNGLELSSKDIEEINNIYLKVFDGDFDYNIKNKEDLADFYNENLDNMFFIIGNDWFLVYTDIYEYINFILWCAEDNKETKIVQSIEMYNTIINLLIENKDKLFKAELQHNTSYNFYLELLNRGYVEEIYCHINTYELNFLNNFKIRLLSNKYNFEDLLDDGLVIPKKKLDHIYFEILFSLTDDFIDKYENIRKLSK